MKMGQFSCFVAAAFGEEIVPPPIEPETMFTDQLNVDITKKTVVPLGLVTVVCSTGNFCCKTK